MRILILTNFYPPFELGGQGQSCREVVEGLKQRGHQVVVLTSMHGTNNMPVEAEEIFRWLYLEMDFVPWRQSLAFFTRRKSRENNNRKRFECLLEQFRPDVVFIWGMWNMSRSLPAFVEASCPGKVVYRFADYWPTLPSQQQLYWKAPARNWFVWLPKQVLGYIAQAMLTKNSQYPLLKFENAICVSAATRDILVEAGIPVFNARIIHTGLDIEQYLEKGYHHSKHKDQNLNLLYAGRLSADKGIDTTIEAMAKLVRDQDLKNVKLSLAGSGSADYRDYLEHFVAQEGLADYVTFLGHVPREEMPILFRKFDILLVPSIWQEPFSRVVLEGMISGLVVVASAIGGTGEIVVDKENGLLFAAGDADDLAQKIMSLATNPELRQELAQAGQETVRQSFTMTRMMDEIENYLQEIALDSIKEDANKEFQAQLRRPNQANSLLRT